MVWWTLKKNKKPKTGNRAPHIVHTKVPLFFEPLTPPIQPRTHIHYVFKGLCPKSSSDQRGPTSHIAPKDPKPGLTTLTARTEIRHRNHCKQSSKRIEGNLDTSRESGHVEGTRFPSIEPKMGPDSLPTAHIYVYIYVYMCMLLCSKMGWFFPF